MALETHGVPQLELVAATGFSGRVVSGLKVHPDREQLVYPLGNTVILRRIKDSKQEFLHGHTNPVSCVSVSRSGVYIASGATETSVHLKVPVIIWDYAQRTIYAQLLIHKAKVEAVAFSPNDKYLVSLGGQDDGSIVVWSIETKQAVCACPASSHIAGPSFTVQFLNTNDNMFVSAGSETVRVWELDLPNRRINPTECHLAPRKRIVKCVEISEDDQFMYCGTTTGDIMKINLESKALIDCRPVKERYGRGVTAIKILGSGNVLVGSGSGTLALCSRTNFKSLKNVQLENGVTSIAVRGEGQQIFVGTTAAQMYRLSYDDFKAELISTSHTSAVKETSIAFGISEIFATCSEEDIRLWNINKPKELLRITVPNVSCNALDITADGHRIISAWNDDKIRVFGPESGRLMHIINYAHNLGVTAIAGSRDSKRVVSGGGDGQVRVWSLLDPHGHQLLETMEKHKAAVTCIRIRSDDKECVTASSDSTCVIWDLERFTSLQTLTGRNTVFRTVCYHPDYYQLITCGTNTKITYWEIYDGSAIRELQGCQSGAINAMHITQDGQHFVTGGDDKLVKVWDYMKGVVTHVGVAHSSTIKSIKVCANNRTLISTSADGAILRWRFPHPPSS